MRQKRSAEFKAKIAIEALKEDRTLNEIGGAFEVHPLQVGQWKKHLQENAKEIFADKRLKNTKDSRTTTEEDLQRKIGQQTMEIEWLKKKLGI
jgi:transposase